MLHKILNTYHNQIIYREVFIFIQAGSIFLRNTKANIVSWTYGENNRRPLYFTRVTESSGWITTDIIFNNHLLDKINVGTKCYGYWAVFVDNANIKFKTCISAYATWMNDHKEALERFKIRELFILGTHNSGAYRLANVIESSLFSSVVLTQVSVGSFRHSQFLV